MSQTPHKLPPVKWTLSELIDYELYLDADKHKDRDSLIQRDRSIRDQIISKSTEKPSQEDSPHNRRWWLYQWLNYQNKQKDDTEPSIGALCLESLKNLGFLLCLAATVLGFIFTLDLIVTAEVILVSYVLLLYLLPQVLFVILASWAFLSQRLGRTESSSLGVRALLSNVLSWIASRKGSQTNELRLQKIQAATGLLIGRGKIHRDSLGWPLLATLQKAGVSFSLFGIICLFVVGLASPRNFGWGSSAKWVDANTAHTITTTLSVPWSWLIPEGVGSPTLDEVRSSQIFIGKDLPENFPHLSSMWVFMCLCLITYTLMPRAALYTYSKWRVHQTLNQEKFSDSRSDQLFRRLANPQLITTTTSDENTLLENQDTATTPTPEPSLKAESQLSPTPVTEPVFIPKSIPAPRSPTPNQARAINERVPQAHCEIVTELELTDQQLTCLKQRFREFRHLGIHKSNRAYSKQEREATFERLRQLEWQDGIPRIILLYRGCDPIVSNFRMLVKACTKIIGTEGQLFFCLVSRRNSTSPPISPKDYQAWSEYVNAHKLQHPNSEIIDLTKETL